MTAAVITGSVAVLLVVALIIRSRARAERCILFLLSDYQEHHGLELVHKAAGRLNRGTIYVHLASLEERGRIVSRPDPLSGFRGIRLYRLPPCGDSGVA